MRLIYIKHMHFFFIYAHIYTDFSIIQMEQNLIFLFLLIFAVADRYTYE